MMQRCVNDIFLYYSTHRRNKKTPAIPESDLILDFPCKHDPKTCTHAQTQTQRYGKGK